ncbi:hypothetical protein C4585_02725 [Candidatus Parcubacteria bacterium]|nr:MAG: hypothetical protein C4585_02725 [Candidatus Parcubacteria bacterium]
MNKPNQPTIEELQKEVQLLLSQISTLSGWYPSNADMFEKENQRIERYLSDLTQRQGVLLTVAGLLSLFPVFEIAGTLSYFLIWVVPFLVLAIVTYILSSKRINIISKLNTPVLPPDSRMVNEFLKHHYYSVLKFHKITDAALVTFFVSFIASFYMFIFVGFPELRFSIFLMIVSILLGYLRFSYTAGFNKRKFDVSDHAAMSVPTIPDHDILFGGYKPQDMRMEEKE